MKLIVEEMKYNNKKRRDLPKMILKGQNKRSYGLLETFFRFVNDCLWLWIIRPYRGRAE